MVMVLNYISDKIQKLGRELIEPRLERLRRHYDKRPTVIRSLNDEPGEFPDEFADRMSESRDLEYRE